MHRGLFKSILKARPNAGAAAAGSSDNDRELQVATCALFLEIARADNEFLPEEEQKIEELMRGHFKLSVEAFREIQRLSGEKLRESIDLWQFAKTIKEHYSPGEKKKIIEMLWAVIYTDDSLDAHEDYLVHKLATLLDLDYRDLIDAKVRIIEQRKG